MPKMKMIFKTVGKFLSKNSPTILTGLGIAGMFGSVAMTVKATPKVQQLLEERREELGMDDLSGKEILKTATPVCWPIAAVMLSSTTCLIFANSVNLRRNAALATAYQLSERAFKDYQDQVIEEIGEKKASAIKDKIAQKHVEDDPPIPSNVIITGNGDYLCRDEISGRYFRSNIEKIRQAVNKFNKRFITDNVMCLNDFYDELDLPHIDIGYGTGWVLEKMDDLLEVHFTSALADIDGHKEPCLVLNYMVEPTYDFRDY